jgi:hypothetical protein
VSKLFKTLSVLAVLVSGAAFASERCNTGNGYGYGYHPASSVDTYDNDDGITQVVVAPPPAPAGHYEIRQVRTFVPGHWMFIRRGHHMVKTFNPSHYELVSQRVWVNDLPYRYTQVAPPPPVQSQGGVTFGLSFNGLST